MNERILVTGGSGRLGSQVVTELLEHGYEVVSIDRVRPAQRLPLGARFVLTDLGDVGEIAYGMKRCEAVIHLGAIASPYSHPDEVVFGNNTGATFAVLQAASLLGITRAAIASSVSGYGMAWSERRFFAKYVPLDEEHPLLNHDAYGLSKEVDERTAQMFARRDGMSVACLRFHWVARREEQLGRPEYYGDDEAFTEGGRGFWGYIDIRDAARALRLAIEVAREAPYGFEPFNVVASDTLLDVPTEEAIQRVAPDTVIRSPLEGCASAFDIGKAQRILGWEPRHSWRDAE
ncbi:MAG: NAD(P)-dependent oxidoreductase [Chloroflexota bacterium]|nr:NAD(P)-dependent oxidoreductase [Chloroflexota bacterium]